MVCTFTNPLSLLSCLTQVLIGVDVLIHAVLLLETVSYWVIILFLDLLNNNLLSLDPVLSLNTGVSPMLFLKLVGYVICFMSYIVLFLQPLLFIVIMLVLFICPAILFIINTQNIILNVLNSCSSCSFSI